MNVLIVCSGNFPDPERNFNIHQAFINDQMEALNKYHNVNFDIYLIKGKGITGYFSNIIKLRRKIKNGDYDLVHAHFNLSGLVSLAAGSIPVVITFHGSDINKWIMNILSSFTSLWADHVIFVSDNLFRKAFIKTSNHSIIPCGVDFDLFYPEHQSEARKAEGMDNGSKYILFSSSFNIKVKNYSLARRAMERLGESIVLLELKDRTRDQVRTLINACDVLLMTSFNEGSPQVIKEAMACNCPIVSTDVGDVKEVTGNTEGCYIITYRPGDVSEKIKQALAFGKPTSGREKIRHLDNRIIAGKVFDVYKKVLKI